MAGRIWVENKVDFSNPRNLITVAAPTAGAGDLTLKFGAFTMGGMGPQPSAPSSSIKFSRGKALNNSLLAPAPLRIARLLILRRDLWLMST